jgi:hypothetical protein
MMLSGPGAGRPPATATACRRMRRWVAAVVAAAMMAGCPAPPSQPPPATSPRPTTTTSAPSSAPGGAATALEAYRRMWTAYLEAIRIPDPAYPDLARYSQGNALNLWVRGLATVQQQGLVGRGEVTLNPSVRAANPNASPPTVEIEDCVDTSRTRLVRKDGSPYQDTPGGRRSARATVARVGERVWKVTEFAIFGVGTC